PPAETTLSCSGDPTDPVYPYCTNDASLSLYCVDNGGGCVGANNKDFVVQAFRSTVPPGSTVPPVTPIPGVPAIDDGKDGYLLGVRVYRADLFDGSRTLSTTEERQRPGSNLTSKVGTNAGGTGKALAGGSDGPLVEFTTEVPPQAEAGGGAWDSLCKRLGGNGCPTTPPTP
ncbi:MAG: hypothetical protein WBG73_15210, partial [Coleofasciculaceae cyanobacterium]